MDISCVSDCDTAVMASELAPYLTGYIEWQDEEDICRDVFENGTVRRIYPQIAWENDAPSPYKIIRDGKEIVLTESEIDYIIGQTLS